MQFLLPDLVRVPTSFVNSYFIGEYGAPWVVVDTGLPGMAGVIKSAAAARFGPDSRPEAIILTHGHFDHAGNAKALADHWGVPVYAHRLELPYLTGRSDYPPPDPTVGGAIAMLSRILPHGSRDLGTRLRALSGGTGAAGTAGTDSGPMPGLDGWRWIHTPGHAPGHIVLFRESDRTVIAGDAIATTNLDSYYDLLTKQQELAAAGSPFICDWDAYESSVQTIVETEPVTLACGHGFPMLGGEVAGDLERFARHLVRPAHGRYVHDPARTDERGVDSLPPRPADPFPFLLGAAGIGLILALTLYPKLGNGKRR